MTTPPTMSLTDLARRLDLDPKMLADCLQPRDGLRVWGSSGISTVHCDGKIQWIIANRRVHTVRDPP